MFHNVSLVRDSLANASTNLQKPTFGNNLHTQVKKVCVKGRREKKKKGEWAGCVSNREEKQRKPIETHKYCYHGFDGASVITTFG